MGIFENYKQAIETIKVGEKYTMFGFGEFGFASSTQTVIEKMYINEYAQYDNALYIIHRPKRKRTSYRKIILPYQELTIFNGWVDINTDAAWKTEHKDGMTIRSSNYTSFDKRNISDSVDKLGIKPLIVIHNQDYYVNVDELECIYKIVTNNGAQEFTLPELKERYEVTGIINNKVNRIELQGQPILKGLLSPMFDGYKNEKAVIRYETQEVYNVLSN